jgi:hypothetical protein
MKPTTLPEDRRPVLQPPRFGLLSLLLAIAGLSGLFAIVHYFGAYGAAIAILFVLCVAAHVVGNALGTKLREFGDTPLEVDGTPARRAPFSRPPTPAEFAPLTRLRQRYSLGKRIVVITVGGAVAGGLLGFFTVLWLADQTTAWHVFGLGVLACAVLGGIWTFAAASFVQVTWNEFLDARRDSSRP